MSKNQISSAEQQRRDRQRMMASGQQPQCQMGGNHNWHPCFHERCFCVERPQTHDTVQGGVLCTKCGIIHTFSFQVLKTSVEMTPEAQQQLLQEHQQRQLQEAEMQKRVAEAQQRAEEAKQSVAELNPEN